MSHALLVRSWVQLRIIETKRLLQNDFIMVRRVYFW